MQFHGIYILEFFKDYDGISKFFRTIIILVSLISILIIGDAIPVDYGWFGIATVWIFYLFKENKAFRTITYALGVITYYLYRNAFIFSSVDWLSVMFTILPAIIILFYNEKQGKKFKYFFYWFYPIHMLIIYLISLITIN